MFKPDGIINKEGAAYQALKAMAVLHFTGHSVHPEQSIEAAIDEAVYTFMDRTHLSTVKPVHYAVIVKVAEYLINRRGTLGTKSERLEGITTEYTEDLPRELINRINKYRTLPKPKEVTLW